MKKQNTRAKGPTPPKIAVTTSHLVLREHTQHLSNTGLDELFQKIARDDAGAKVLLPLVVSAASAIGNQHVLVKLRERPEMPVTQARALTLDLMARAGNVDDATVERYLAAAVPNPGVRTSLAWLSYVRKSSFTRNGAPLPAETVARMVIDVDDASREDLFTMGRMLHLIDSLPDFEAILKALRGHQARRFILLEHTCSMLLLQADLQLCAPDRGRSESLARRMVLLTKTGAVTNLSRGTVLLQAGYSLLYGGRPQEAEKVLREVRTLADGAPVLGLHGNVLAGLGDLPAGIRKLDEQVRSLFAKPIHDSKGGSGFNTELAGGILKDVNLVLRRAGLKPFIISGTLLGYVREGAILKHDKDFDIGLLGWEAQYTAAEALLKSRRYRIDPTRLTGHDLYCMPVTNIQTNMSFDMFIFHDKGDHYLHGIDFLIGFTLHFRWTKFDLQEIEFLGEKFWAPDDIPRFLTENYGPDYMTPDPGYHVKLEAPAIAHRASHVVNFLAHLDIASAIRKKRDKAYMNRLADICEHLLTPGFRPSDELIARLRRGLS
jgi:hypothetical protein